jgi:arginyl-tRNA synthetase
MNILQELRTRFERVLSDYSPEPAALAQQIRPAQDARFGDYQANFAMALAKSRGVNPQELAREIAGKVDLSDLCEPPEVAGPGFINLKLHSRWITTQSNRQAHDPRCGVDPVARPLKVIVDYSSPNVAKPMHVGHLRSSVIGDALYRILKYLGHDVVSDNHIGDWGTQFGMIIYGYKHFLDQPAYAANPVGELARLYRLVNQLEGYHEAVAALPGLKDRLGAAERAHAAAKADACPARIGSAASEDCRGGPAGNRPAALGRSREHPALEPVHARVPGRAQPHVRPAGDPLRHGSGRKPLPARPRGGGGRPQAKGPGGRQ